MESEDDVDLVGGLKRVNTEDEGEEGGSSSGAATVQPERLPEEELYAIAAAWISTGHSPEHPKAAEALDAEWNVFARAVAAAPSRRHGALKGLLSNERAKRRLLQRIEETEAAVERLYANGGIKSARDMHQHVTDNDDLTPTQRRAYEDFSIARDRLSDIYVRQQPVHRADAGGGAQDNGAGGAAHEKDAGGAVESQPPTTTTSTPKMQVDSASAQPRQEEQGNDLIKSPPLSDLWNQFVTEAGRIPRAGTIQHNSRNIQDQTRAHYIRWCYDALWDNVLQNTLRCSCESITQMRGKGTAVLGTPGIGKTVYLLYILRRYLASKTLRAIFPDGVLYVKESSGYLMTMSGHVEVFEEDEFSWSKFKGNNNLLVIIDPAGQALKPKSIIFNKHRPVIVLSSPRQVAHGELWKDNGLVAMWMPVWTRRELAQCLKASGKEGERLLSEEEPHDPNAETSADKVYSWYGGIPRHVMRFGKGKSSKMLRDDLEVRVSGLTIQELDAMLGPGAQATSLTHMMFHILVDYRNEWVGDDEYPPEKPKVGMQHILGQGERRFYVDPIGTLRQTMFQRYRVGFASDFVEGQIWARKRELYKRAAGRVLLHSPVTEIPPMVMERYALLRIAEGGSLQCRKVASSAASYDGVAFPKKDLKILKEPINVKEVLDKTMYAAWPRFPAIDGWSSEGLFQITLGNHHGFTAGGNDAHLNNAVAAAKAAYRKKYGRKKGKKDPPLYIVTLQGKNDSYYTQRQRTSDVLQNCEQYVMCLYPND